MIKNLTILNNNKTKLITVENLTSFHMLNIDAIIIYLGGFHNHSKQMLLTKIYEMYPDITYYHFGDIDAGGFYVFNNLKEKTGINFIPYRMDIKELEENKSYLKTLTDNDIKRLKLLLEDEKFYLFHDIIKYMLDNNVKLEQEILD